ncbi:TPA: GlxA family transcriptional regulator [Pseudomonas aeruginosa]|uniref:GlxA family transcriptional regulator n=1 Tax=Pseudomonas weihenstephanensis TaxID=1608994 RepID=A0ABS1ZNS5_9PSED|nr:MULTISPECIES: GlxA family transcriptional regulator [Pseudomonas]AFN66394.1 putative transcriptional regulator [uncultured bacterium]EIU2596839.1 GlxA family transcriptional regulator [Pseudomonas aeruginosa]EIU2695922.1 GlxA family transcriptional regulator [Pseudomonas aeruginosa]EIU2845010.1 GlxA family transcriptional regulator [Pseudomonas aeruginosa]EIU9471254.1 GlxA family transcriptional regulator [Pseudomonas aeruginosa]
MPRHVCFLVYSGFVLLDLSGPLEAFSNANSARPSGYRFTVASLEGGLIRASSGLQVATEALEVVDRLDTLIIVGAPAAPIGDWTMSMATAIRHMSLRSRRTASVCTGAFVLAESGLLDGRVATTHWNYAPQLQARYPSLRVDGDRIWTEDGNVWTSAGMSAGIDMALAMIEQDLGKEVARSVARMLVVYYRRPGGQYQFSSLLDFDPGSDRIRTVLSYARDHLRDDLSVERLADVAHMSVRQFGRVFAASIGVTPAKAIERLRIEAARPLVEDGHQTFEEIARSAGFGDADHMLRCFVRVIGRTPQELRRSVRQANGDGGSGSKADQ